MNVNQLPYHNHVAAASTTEIAVSNAAGEEGKGMSNFIANHPNAFNTAETAGASLATGTSTAITGSSGGNGQHNNVQPSLAIQLSYCITRLLPS